MRSRHSVIAIALIALFSLFTAVSCGKKQASDPKDAFHSFQAAISDKDFASAWDMLSGASQAKFEKTFFDETKKEIHALTATQKKEPHPVLGKTGEEIMKMSPRDFFILLMGSTEAGSELSQKGATELEGVTVSGTTATLTFKDKDKSSALTMVREKNAWKVNL